jgi:TrmH family RNA methyltransferase
MITKAEIQSIKALADKRGRTELGAFIAEGEKLVAELLSSHLVVRKVYATKELFAGAEVIAERDMERISQLKSSNSTLAVVEIPHYDLQQAEPKQNLVLALDRVQNPGNLGTIIRLADWFGITDIVCSADSADCFNPKVIQATMGAIIRVRVHYTDLSQWLAQQKERGVNIYGTFLDGENIYRSPYVLQYWARKRGKTCIADLYRNGLRGEDPVITYQRLYGLTQQQFCDEMIDACQHIVPLDLGHAWSETRQYACTFDSPMQSVGKNRYAPADEVIPEDYGFNAIRLQPIRAGRKVTAVVESDSTMRYGFVAVTADGKAHYGAPVSSGKATFTIPRGQEVRALYLVVMGAPTEHKMLTWWNRTPNRQYPYVVEFKGVSLE